MGNVPGSNSPTVTFSKPSNPLSGLMPVTFDTNNGRDVNTLSRKFPTGWFDGGQGDTPPSQPLKGCSPDAWGYTK